MFIQVLTAGLMMPMARRVPHVVYTTVVSDLSNLLSGTRESQRPTSIAPSEAHLTVE